MRERGWKDTKSRILSLAACGLKQQPPSLSYREPPPPTRRANEHRHKGVECTCGWPLVIFIGRVYRRAYRGEKKGRGKREKKKKEGKRLARKNGATDFFSPALISRRDEQISRDEQRYDFFLLFFFFFSFRQSVWPGSASTFVFLLPVSPQTEWIHVYLSRSTIKKSYSFNAFIQSKSPFLEGFLHI